MLRARFLHLIMKHAWSGNRTPSGGEPSGRANQYTTAPLNIPLAPVIMSPAKEWTVIRIRATVDSHSDIADDLLAIHGLSGADARPGCFPLFYIGDVHAEIKSEA